MSISLVLLLRTTAYYTISKMKKKTEAKVRTRSKVQDKESGVHARKSEVHIHDYFPSTSRAAAHYTISIRKTKTKETTRSGTKKEGFKEIYIDRRV
jgi:hypothetical protein